jgi:hypothetical protein
MKVKILEIIYRVSKRFLTPMLKKYGHKSFTKNVMIVSEIALKKPIFNCQMCGQCALHFSGMVCPMGCPKNLRNGPCGGVRQDESCEINPDMKCVWVKAWENSKAMRTFSKEIYNIQPALDRSLRGTSAWINEIQN